MSNKGLSVPPSAGLSGSLRGVFDFLSVSVPSPLSALAQKSWPFKKPFKINCLHTLTIARYTE